MILCGYDAGYFCDQSYCSAAMPMIPSRTKIWGSSPLKDYAHARLVFYYVKVVNSYHHN